jgi:hypothetical protein
MHHSSGIQYQAMLEGCNDARTGIPPGIPEGAMCVQRFDDSLNSAIHITYRISLRSSSMPEPRDPLLKVLTIFIVLRRHNKRVLGPLAGTDQLKPVVVRQACQSNKGIVDKGWEIYPEGHVLCNDPSAAWEYLLSQAGTRSYLNPIGPPLFDL